MPSGKPHNHHGIGGQIMANDDAAGSSNVARGFVREAALVARLPR